MIVFLPYGRRLKASKNETLLKVASKGGIEIQSLCGGRGLCGRCKVIVREGNENLSPFTEPEEKILTKKELLEGYRLACQTRVIRKREIKIEIPAESRLDKQRLLEEGVERSIQLKPAVKKIVLTLRSPTLKDVKPDVERLLEKIQEKTGREPKICYETLKSVPLALREGGWTVTITLWLEKEVICVEAGERKRGIYGLAVDIGTTKLAVYLTDLESGRTIATASDMNPQILYGEDVISRISFISEKISNLKILQRTIVKGINNLITEVCNKARIKNSEICDMTVVGNTAMHHIFLGVPPKYISLSPYPAVIGSSVNIRARDLGVKINKGAYIHVLPVIAGFVGADAVADILATGIHESKEKSMLIDIGTNTEIVLSDGKDLYACSCASGPAFEGAHIAHGIRAVEGAIERVWIDPETFEPKYKTIGNKKPKGICGSAIVDIVAEMLKTGIIKHNGTFNKEIETSRLRKRDGNLEFIIAYSPETWTGRDIVVTQRDIREIQLAKAAIYAGTSILMKKVGIKPQELERIYIAGAFGNYIDPESAQTVGMYPETPLDRVKFVGNTAGSGARMTLLSTEVRETANRIARKVHYLELGADPDFQKEFLKATYLPHMDPQRFPKIMKILKA